MKKQFDAREVKALAQGRWLEIFAALAPSLNDAVKQVGRHVACPVHGGVDGFRLFPQAKNDGSGICNTCGAKTDGFMMLEWVNGWKFAEAVNAVGEFLNAPTNMANTTPIEEQRFGGKLTRIETRPYKGMRGNAMSTQIILETEDGQKKALWGSDLLRACASVNVGDWVEVCKIATRTVSRNGKTFQKSVWTCRKVMSPQEKRESEEKQSEQEAIFIERKKTAIRNVWRHSIAYTEGDVRCAAATRYLKRRGINASIDPRVVHVAPKLDYFDAGTKVGTYPALVCAVQDSEGKPVTLHRTYLSADGKKADVREVKKIMAVPNNQTISGGAIRLTQPQGKAIAIAEGIETALSVTTATGLACWSVISEGGMRAFEPPKWVKMVHIFADKDASGVGLDAAKELHQKLKDKGIRSRIYLPSPEIPEGAKGIDWNDVLEQKGEFPNFV